ncbi:DUF615 domain-containing protein [Methylophilaceae bacterium]|jgi:ribosome-associated protein|nr:DUF615 domain-containing protein [Betaproteobacteria bacterium]MDA7751484.1 DUF615 domain-containing protein [Methylophilaceae bacterium]MCH9841877.1 DUF615 domain-containing protein [Betaproteobacteria bacterium]MDA9088048.1 DUF615 domain-containing protein [Methylophilaceae bacterium]MDA9819050.1 DUF615 domain-containing protein [Methylophilaceae bacterium]
MAKNILQTQLDDDETEFISKTELKRDSKKIQAFGKSIGDLSIDQIKSFDLPDAVFIAITEYKSLKSNAAKNRQVQYLGKLLREIDLTQAYQQMDQLKNGSQIEIRKNHIVESWRDKLMQDKEALTKLINEFPHIDRQLIRQLIQNAIKERKDSKPPKFYRQIFRYLKEQIV